MRTRHSTLIALISAVLGACGGSPPPPAAPVEAPAPTGAAPESTVAPPVAPAESAAASSAAASALPVAPPPVEQNIPLLAFQIISTDAKAEVLYDVKADGTIQDNLGKTIGKVDGHDITFAGDSEPVWSVEKDGSVHGALFKEAKGKFDEKDRLVLEAGKNKLTVTIDDKGKVVITNAKGKDSPPWKVVGPVSRARRTAELLSLTISRPKGK